jgi:hypothetical protein
MDRRSNRQNSSSWDRVDVAISPPEEDELPVMLGR